MTTYPHHAAYFFTVAVTVAVTVTLGAIGRSGSIWCKGPSLEQNRVSNIG
jgi:hypothetical protein